jgi:diguanylate cyclase (GGDEF)-like protein
VAQIKDITARKKSEQAVRQVQQELEIRVAARTRELAEANTELAEANTKLAESNRKLERLTRIDDLTGLYNRRYLMESLNHTLRTACRYKLPICLLMLDLDHFKRINDTYGHLIGDRVLVTVGRLLKENLRNGSDMAGRFGGEEFCVVLPHTGLDGAMAAAEKLRLTIAKAAILNNEGKTFTVTCSIGLVEGLPSKISGTELLRRADKALYHAKECGRNQIRVA